MKRRLSDHELAERLAKKLADSPSGGHGPAADARVLLQRARDAGAGTVRSQCLAGAQRAIAKLDPVRHRATIQRLQADVLALQGRGGDSKVAHLTPGEIVVPRSLQTPQFLQWLRMIAQAQGIDPARLVVGNERNSINPYTGAPEFGIGDWFSGWFHDPENNVGQSTSQGAAARAAYTGINSADVRADYADKVSALDPLDNEGRSALKVQARDASPPEVGAVIKKFWPDTGPNPGSVGRANVSNAAVNEAARELGTLSKGLGAANVAYGIYDTATSDNPVRTGMANVGSIGGGLLGGTLGAGVGGLLGPAAFVTAPAGAIVGSAAGGTLGYRAGEEVYDHLHDLWNQR